MNITLSEDQEFAFQNISQWLAEGNRINKDHKNPMLLTLGGFAGCGKTVLVSHISKHFDKAIRFAFCALSGRAASVLKKRLKEQGVNFENDNHYCGTIHRLIYRPIENDKGEIIYWARKPEIAFDVIVIDEASMVSEDIYNDISSYGIPILAIGDHGQLPPIQSRFSLMENPDLKLEKIHRQAEGNPIINLSMQIREHGSLPKNYKNSDNVNIIKKSDYIPFLNTVYKKGDDPEKLLDTAVLCYKNATRTNLNSTIRKMIFGSVGPTPITNDLVICLKNNIKNRKIPLYNGYRGYFSSSPKDAGDFYQGKIRFPYEEIETDLNNVSKHQFGYSKTFSSFSELENFGMRVKHWSEVGLLFDYGYAITTHKFQGSQADHVIVFNERPAPVSDEDYKRWLYTAISRAANKLTIII